MIKQYQTLAKVLKSAIANRENAHASEGECRVLKDLAVEIQSYMTNIRMSSEHSPTLAEVHRRTYALVCAMEASAVQCRQCVGHDSAEYHNLAVVYWAQAIVNLRGIYAMVQIIVSELEK